MLLGYSKLLQVPATPQAPCVSHQGAANALAILLSLLVCVLLSLSIRAYPRSYRPVVRSVHNWRQASRPCCVSVSHQEPANNTFVLSRNFMGEDALKSSGIMAGWAQVSVAKREVTEPFCKIQTIKRDKIDTFGNFPVCHKEFVVKLCLNVYK